MFEKIKDKLMEGITASSRIFNLSNLEITDDLTMNIIAKICVIAGMIAAICFICNLGWIYIKSALKRITNPDENSEFANYMEIGKGFFFLFLIAVYPAIAIIITETAEAFNRMSSPTYQSNDKMASLAEKYSNSVVLNFEDFEEEAMKAAENGEIGSTQDQEAAQIHQRSGGSSPNDPVAPLEDTQPDSGSSIKKLLRLLDPATWVTLSLQALFHVAFGLVRIVITLIATIFFKIMVIIGPLAIAFSILPVFQKQLELWFGTLLNTAFVFTTLNILDMLSLGMFEYIMGGKSGTEVLNPSYVIVFDLVLLIIYASAFWLTSKYVGKGDAGKVLSKMVAAGTAAAMLVTSGGASAVAGGNIGNAASAAQGTMNNN